MLKQIVLSCLCFTLFFGACKKDVQVVKYYSHNDSFPPLYIDTLLGLYGCVVYSVYPYTDSLGHLIVAYDSIQFIKVNVFRKAFDQPSNRIYLFGFSFDDIPCRIDSLNFSGSYSDFNWSRNIFGSFKTNDSIYIDTDQGHLGRAFTSYRGKRL